MIHLMVANSQQTDKLLDDPHDIQIAGTTDDSSTLTHVDVLEPETKAIKKDLHNKRKYCPGECYEISQLTLGKDAINTSMGAQD